MQNVNAKGHSQQLNGVVHLEPALAINISKYFLWLKNNIKLIKYFCLTLNDTRLAFRKCSTTISEY